MPGLLPAMFPVLLEGVACILDASFHPGPLNVTDFDAASGRCFVPFVLLPCGDADDFVGVHGLSP